MNDLAITALALTIRSGPQYDVPAADFRVGEHAGELPADRGRPGGHLELCRYLAIVPGRRGDRFEKATAIVAGITGPLKQIWRRQVGSTERGKVLPAMPQAPIFSCFSLEDRFVESVCLRPTPRRRPRFRGRGQLRCGSGPTAVMSVSADRWPRLRRNAARHVPRRRAIHRRRGAGPAALYRDTLLTWRARHDRQRVPGPTADGVMSRGSPCLPGFCWLFYRVAAARVIHDGVRSAIVVATGPDRTLAYVVVSAALGALRSSRPILAAGSGCHWAATSHLCDPASFLSAGAQVNDAQALPGVDSSPHAIDRTARINGRWSVGVRPGISDALAFVHLSGRSEFRCGRWSLGRSSGSGARFTPRRSPTCRRRWVYLAIAVCVTAIIGAFAAAALRRRGRAPAPAVRPGSAHDR